MKRYKYTVIYTSYITVEVDADTEEEAEELVHSRVEKLDMSNVDYDEFHTALESVSDPEEVQG